MSTPDDLVTITDHVYVWCVKLSDIAEESLLGLYGGLLSSDERKRHQRYLLEADQHRYLVTRALVRTTLSRFANVDPRDWRFADNAYGRPAIDAGYACARSLSFNVSHSGHWVVLAVGNAVEVGVDIEDLRRGAPLHLADQCFSESEASDLRRSPLDEQVLRFFELWTLKESYAKARGLGLSLPLDSFAFDLKVPGNVGLARGSPCDVDPAGWRFLISRPDVDHLVSLCFRQPVSRDVEIHWRRIVPLRKESHFEPRILRRP